MKKICVQGFVSGRVQGVFYRRATHAKAIAYGITGWVKNLDDGRVEVMLCGEESAVYALQNWLWEGPSAAKVSAVEIQETPWQEYTQFEIRG